MAENGTKECLVRTMLSLRPELAVVQRLHGVKVSRPRAYVPNAVCKSG